MPQSQLATSNMIDRQWESTNGPVLAHSILPLPLNLIAMIINYLDQPSDLARVCRSCRTLHYMTLPSLYVNVSLHSYDHLRYSPHDGRPEGCGMASPFSMGLNGLVSRNVANYVKKFRVRGEWKDHDGQEYSKVGRVTDASMNLSSLIRVAIERMAVLEDFCWELDTKMLPTVWQGLVLRSNLTHLTIRYPSRRTPQPIALVPPLPNLKSLKLYDIDPLCYGDDVSSLIRDSKKLQDLKLIWNPRMRAACEPSVSLGAFFSQMVAAGTGPPIRKLAFKNLYAINDTTFAQQPFKMHLEEFTFINSIAGACDEADAVFFEHTWRPVPVRPAPNMKMVRTDKVTRQQVDYLSNSTGLEKLYLIGPRRMNGINGINGINGVSPQNSVAFPNSPVSSTNSPSSDAAVISLKDEYLDAVIKHHGSTLRHLLLTPCWRLNSDEIAFIVRHCPNLEQLGIGVEFCDFPNLRLLVPFLPKLTAFRILDNPDDSAFSEKMKALDEIGGHEEKLSTATQSSDWSIKWMGLGDLLFEIGELEEHVVESEQGPLKVSKRRVWKRPLSAAQHVEIFGLDSLEV